MFRTGLFAFARIVAIQLVGSARHEPRSVTLGEILDEAHHS